MEGKSTESVNKTSIYVQESNVNSCFFSVLNLIHNSYIYINMWETYLLVTFIYVGDICIFKKSIDDLIQSNSRIL